MAENTGVVYGTTNCYKTWNLGLLAMYYFKKTKKPTRLVTADGGGYKPILPFVKAGIIEPYVITDDPKRILMMQRIMDGYWPAHLVEGKRQSKELYKPDTLVNIAGYIFEGMTSIAESLQRIYEGRSTGMKPAYTEVIQSDLKDTEGKLIESMTIGGYSQDSYGLIQSMMMRFVNFSWALPVDFVWWSGHEASAEDDLTRKIVRGVKFVGKAATPDIGKNVGSMIHAVKVETGTSDKGEKTHETRYYFMSHPDSMLKNVFWDAKTRVPGDKVDKLLEAYKPEGYFVPEKTKGLDEYIAKEDELVREGTEEVMRLKEEILKG
jgi:hypothetical protein